MREVPKRGGAPSIRFSPTFFWAPGLQVGERDEGIGSTRFPLSELCLL